MAREVGAIVVGAAVTYFSGGNYQLGFLAASVVYGATAPDAKVQGPRLNDLKAPQASYGGAIPYIEGAPRVAGTYAWYSDKREIANESSQDGKGGPGVDTTLYTYEMDVLILFSINELVGIRRVWSNGKLVWTRAEDADIESLITSNQTTSWRDMRFYTGASGQLPDSTYEAAVGIGNAPAYRGRASVFIEGLNLGGSGQLPVLTFEVMSASVASYVTDARASVSSVGGVGLIPVGICSLNPAGCEIHVPKFDATYANNTIRVFDVVDNNDRVYQDPKGRDYDLEAAGGSEVKGTSDRSVYVVGTGIREAKMYDSGAISGATTFDFGLSNSPESYKFARRGSAIVFAGGDRKLYRFGLGGGFAAATSGVLMPVPAQSLAISTDGYVYVARGDGASVLRYDLATLTLQATILKPAAAASALNLRVMCDGATLYLLAEDDLYSHDSGSWSLRMENLPTQLGITGSRQDFAVWDEVLWSLDDGGGGSGAVYTIHAAAMTVTPAAVPLEDVVSRICLRTGQLSAGDIDVTGLVGSTVRAFAIAQVAPSRTALEALMAAHLFEAVEGQKIRFVKRGGTPALTIPYADLGASADGTAEPLPLRRMNDIELPARVTIKYANVLNDFQDGAESGDRLVTQSTAVTVVELPMGLTPTEAKRIADANTMDLAVSLIGLGPVALTRKYPQLEPTDVVLLSGKDGSTYRARIQKATAAALGTNTLEMVLDDATVINSVAATDNSYASSQLVRMASSTQLLALDIPILRDADDGAGWYIAMNASTPWAGAALLRSPDSVNFTQAFTTTTKAVTGLATTVLGPWAGGAVFDERSSVTVDVGEGQLSSLTRDALLNTTGNALLVGDEIIQFRTAALLSAGVYTLSGLLRGQRGTEWATDAHAIGDTVALLTSTGLRRLGATTAEIGVPLYVKAVSIGNTAANVQAQTITNTGVALKPFSVCDMRQSTVAGVLTVTWKRRTRYATRFCGPAGIYVPLGESAEAYRVELRDGGSALVLAENVSTAAWSHAAAGLGGYTLTVAQLGAGITGTPNTLDL